MTKITLSCSQPHVVYFFLSQPNEQTSRPILYTTRLCDWLEFHGCVGFCRKQPQQLNFQQLVHLSSTVKKYVLFSQNTEFSSGPLWLGNVTQTPSVPIVGFQKQRIQ